MAKTIAIPEQCPMDVGLNILSGKWKLRILWHISRKPIRFNELQRSLGTITTKTQKIVLRTVYPEMPLRVEYSLTALGESIQPILKALCDWGTSYQKATSSVS